MSFPDRISLTLTRHGLRQTAVRQAVLRVVADSPFALSGSEIEQHIVPALDRITLYRTLRSFEESGIIHRVVDTSDVVRYAACSIECSAHEHFDNHVHFKCNLCQHIYCLNQVAVPPVNLPAKFEVKTRDYLLAGVCNQCQPV